MLHMTDRSAPRTMSSADRANRGPRNLMATIGVLLMATPTAELAVQVYNEERPHFALLGGLFVIGLLTISHALSRRPDSTTSRMDSTPSMSSGRPHGITVWPEEPSR